MERPWPKGQAPARLRSSMLAPGSKPPGQQGWMWLHPLARYTNACVYTYTYIERSICNGMCIRSRYVHKHCACMYICVAIYNIHLAVFLVFFGWRCKRTCGRFRIDACLKVRLDCLVRLRQMTRQWRQCLQGFEWLTEKEMKDEKGWDEKLSKD